MKESFLYQAYLQTPPGLLRLRSDEDYIRELYFVSDETFTQEKDSVSPLIKEALTQLKAYFKSELNNFDLPLSPEGSEFQKTVWEKLQSIPYGHTTSYGKIASQMGDENYTRAVGSANGKNPIAIIIPCHRVIGSNGSLTGYAGGLHRKKWLLDFESVNTGKQISLF